MVQNEAPRPGLVGFSKAGAEPHPPRQPSAPARERRQTAPARRNPMEPRLERVGKAAMRYRWPPRLAALLGKLPDHQVARRAGLHPQTVTVERRRRDLPPPSPRRPRVRLRRELGIPNPPRPSVWTAAALGRLGKVPDAMLARELGVGVAYVAQRRQRHRLLRHRRWTPEQDRQLGTGPNRALAERLGRSLSAVNKRRRLLARRDASEE